MIAVAIFAALFINKTIALSFSRLPSTDSPPSNRQYLCGDYYSSDKSIILFGGNQGISSTFNSVWQYNLTSNLWQKLVPISSQAPLARYTHGCWVDDTNSKLYIFGGNSDNGPQNDMWVYDLSSLQWTQVLQKGSVPASRFRFGYSKYIDSNGKLKLILFGGTLSTGYSSSLYIFDVETTYWTKMTNTTSLVPNKLNGPLVQYYDGYVYVFGGDITGNKELGIDSANTDTLRYSLASSAWTNITNINHKYEYRYFSGSVVYNKAAYLLYGWSDNTSQDIKNIMKLDFTDPDFKWAEVTVSYSSGGLDRIPRDSFAYVLADSAFYIFGGYSSNEGIMNDLVKFDLTQNPVTYTILSDLYTGPDSRESHSLCVMDGLLYLFGGTNGNSFVNDLWVYDPDTDLWESVKAEGTTPSARSGHAASSQGDVMIIFGGKDDSGYLNDMYQFNTLSNQWQEVNPTSSSSPSARTGACMQIYMPYIIIFGGKTSAGLSREVWSYDSGTNEYTLLYDGTGDEGPTPVIGPACELQLDDYGNMNLITMYGTADGEVPLGDVDLFNLTSQKWTKLYTTNGATPLTNRAQAIIKKMNSTIVVMGGEQWSTDVFNDLYILNLNTSTTTTISSLPDYYYNAAFAYYKTILYIHGGGAVYGQAMRTSVTKSSFLEVDLKCPNMRPCPYTCSPGTYLNSTSCVECPKGSYSENYGVDSCTKCPKGSFNPLNGANTVRQCYPCSQNSFNNEEGASSCKNCPAGKTCPVGSTKPLDDSVEISSSSIQPKLYSKSDGDAQNAIDYMVITIMIITFFVLVSIYFFRGIRLYLQKIDLYSDKHNYILDAPMKLMKTRMGGLFSIFFIILAIILIASDIITFEMANIEETKALVPLVTLQNEISVFTGYIRVYATFFRYGGECVTEKNTCQESISYNLYYITYDKLQVNCTKSSENDCTISLACSNCVVETGAYIQYNLLEVSSYTSAISVNVTSTSSIPNELSSINEVLVPNDNSVFRGYNPTQFFYTMTPSYFRSYVSDWTDKVTGYHVSVASSPVGGSQYTITELPFTSDLKLQVYLAKSDTSLYTTRAAKQTVIILISTLLGSVFGVMSAIGGVMRITEKSWNYTDTTVKHKKAKKGLSNNRNNYKNMLKDDQELKDFKYDEIEPNTSRGEWVPKEDN
ncbi:unnamed protein product [Blepharisma stoltei]|uniref:Tyrosine-protein kinase ephrin type A/B receptor-like domain-containing protein n=1 Tax=Blepharisma stoltei TaxID=1481888 RepID=A0AAU9K150_9CILI|nr:unnamed protein product [Blepharisma stoltei]